jgi:hypothetical protein
MGNNSSRKKKVIKTEFHKLEMVMFRGRFRGIRGATYKIAKHFGAMSPEEEPIKYGSEASNSRDLYIVLFFYSLKQREDFSKCVKNLEHVPDIVKKTVEDEGYNPTFEEKFFDPELLQFSTLNYVKEPADTTPPGSVEFDFDHMVQDLSSFRSGGGSEPAAKRSRSRSSSGGKSLSSFRRSDRITFKMPSAGSPLYKWQCLEDLENFGDPYECHLIDKANNGPNHNNNLLALSWPFHQLFDGLKLETPHNVPGLVVEFLREDGTSVDADDGTRYKVWVKVRFLDMVHNVDMKNTIKERMKVGSRECVDGSIESFVHVLDVEEFRFFLNIKAAHTMLAWGKYRKARV